MEGEVTFDGVSVSKLKPHERMRLGLFSNTSKRSLPGYDS